MNNIESSVEVSEFTFADKVAEQIVMEALFMERFGVPVSYLEDVSELIEEVVAYGFGEELSSVILEEELVPVVTVTPKAKAKSKPKAKAKK